MASSTSTLRLGHSDLPHCGETLRLASSPARARKPAERAHRTSRSAIGKVACVAPKEPCGTVRRSSFCGVWTPPERPTRRRTVPSAGAAVALAALACFGAAAWGVNSSTMFHLRRPAAPRQHGRNIAASSNSAGASAAHPSGAVVQLTAVAPLETDSPFGGGSVSWKEALMHLQNKMEWANSSFVLSVHDVSSAVAVASAEVPAGRQALQGSLAGSQVVAVFGVSDDHPAADELIRMLAASLSPTVVALGCGPRVRAAIARLGGRAPLAPTGLLQALINLLPGSLARHDAEPPSPGMMQVLESVEELYSRQNSDDLLYSLLVLINEHVSEVPAVANSAKSKNAGTETLKCMVGKCGKEIFRCYADTSCRTALSCLDGCKFNDQVCSYRCIASYESPALAAFSLCILQKHNCLGLTAEAPQVPDPKPMTSFKGQPMSHELAEDMFIGWLQGASAQSQALPMGTAGQESFSWRVFAGKNPAYDFFPCQFQLFYRGQARGSMWYDPIFKVQTLDGREVWRRRHYRVRRAKVPGTFHLSVLDNGVISDEYWRILDCQEDLDWCIFYYSGAAAAAGVSYSGAILASPSGTWPAGAADRARIDGALDMAGIKSWELRPVWSGS